MASAYQNSHNIAQQVWNEFGQDLRRLGFKKFYFSFVNNYAAGMPNISRLPKIGQINGPSGHFGWDRAHATAWQATRESTAPCLKTRRRETRALAKPAAKFWRFVRDYRKGFPGVGLRLA